MCVKLKDSQAATVPLTLREGLPSIGLDKDFREKGRIGIINLLPKSELRSEDVFCMQQSESLRFCFFPIFSCLRTTHFNQLKHGLTKQEKESNPATRRVEKEAGRVGAPCCAQCATREMQTKMTWACETQLGALSDLQRRSPSGSSWTLLFWGPAVLQGGRAVGVYSHLMLHPVIYPKRRKGIGLGSYCLT